MSETTSTPSDNSEAHLQLLAEMTSELMCRIDPLISSPPTGIPGYKYAMCTFIAHAAKGFLTLQREGNKQGSRLHIRPCIEASFKLCAVHNEPRMLLSIAYSEHTEEGKFLKAAKDNHLIATPEQHAAKWTDKYRPRIVNAVFSGETIQEKLVSAFDLSRTANMPDLYDFQYRLYCNATHATLRGVMSPSPFIPAVDYSSIGGCLFSALFVMDFMGHKVGHLQQYLDRTKALMKSAVGCERVD